MTKRTIDINASAPSGDAVLHFDEIEKQNTLAADILDLIESRFRQDNGVTEDDARLLCGGCVRALLHRISTEALDRMGASDPERINHFNQQYHYEHQKRTRLPTLKDLLAENGVTVIELN